ncbi:MAG: DUF5329 domain-containing protein [Usitatibacter sp.]
MRNLIAALALAIPLASFAQPAAPPIAPRAQTEIDHLFDYISNSGCRFNRNGSWHDMAAARTHVGNKFEYLRERGQVDSAESFIENAASQSSFSGKDYLVRCPGAGAVPSNAWLKAELARYRQQRRG